MNDNQQTQVKNGWYTNSPRLTELNQRIGFFAAFDSEKIDGLVKSLPAIADRQVNINNQRFAITQLKSHSDIESDEKLLKFSLAQDNKSGEMTAFIYAYHLNTDNAVDDYVRARDDFFFQLSSSSMTILPFKKFHDIGTVSVRMNRDIEPTGNVFWVYQNVFVNVFNSGLTENEVLEVSNWLQQQIQQQSEKP